VFCNPPWSDITPWVVKAYASACLTVFVLPARTDTEWYALMAASPSNTDLRFFRKRVPFIRDGVCKHPTDGTLVAIIRNMHAPVAEPAAEPLPEKIAIAAEVGLPVRLPYEIYECERFENALLTFFRNWSEFIGSVDSKSLKNSINSAIQEALRVA